MIIAKQYSFGELAGISAKQLEQHVKLYEGYVANANKVQELIAALQKEGKFNVPEYNELKRRYGWELNGAKLHEYYFDNLKGQGGELPDGPLRDKIAAQWGSYEAWKADFAATGMLRGIGWAILYHDAATGELANQWIAEHEGNHFPHAHPLLVLDAWEHAYIGDYLATERKKYIEAFMGNVNWETVAMRYQQG